MVFIAQNLNRRKVRPKVAVDLIAAAPGAGKTHALIHDFAPKVIEAGEKLVILQPTKLLIDHTFENEVIPASLAHTCKVFHGDSVARNTSVSREFTEFLQADASFGTSLFLMSVQTLPHLRQYWSPPPDLHLVFDEVPDVFDTFRDYVPTKYRHWVLEHVDVDATSRGPGFVKLKVSRRSALLKKVHRNRPTFENDPDLKEVWGLLLKLANSHYDVFVNRAKFERFRNSGGELVVYSVLKPTILDGFASVTIAASNPTDSLMHHIWQAYGVEFHDNHDYDHKLRFQHPPHSDKTTIYRIGERDWSRTWMDTTLADAEADVFHRLIAPINVVFGGERCAIQINKRHYVNGGLPPEFVNATLVPHNPHGLNVFTGLDHIAVLPAKNPRSDDFAFLRYLGVGRADVRRAIHDSETWQTLMRSSLRDPTNLNPKKFILTDEVAEYIKAQVPGSKIVPLPGVPDDIASASKRRAGRPRVHDSEAAKKRAHRTAKKIKELLDGLDAAKLASETGEYAGYVASI